MDVNDAELLALAGDDSSDEGNTPAPSAPAKTAWPLPPTIIPPITVKETSTGMGNSNPNIAAKATKAKYVKKRKADSEDEGEA